MQLYSYCIRIAGELLLQVSVSAVAKYGTGLDIWECIAELATMRFLGLKVARVRRKCRLYLFLIRGRCAGDSKL